MADLFLMMEFFVISLKYRSQSGHNHKYTWLQCRSSPEKENAKIIITKQKNWIKQAASNHLPNFYFMIPIIAINF